MGNANTMEKMHDTSLLMNEEYDYGNVKVVYESDELGILEEGVCFVISGQILLTCERFLIELLVDKDEGDIALSLQVRLPQNYIHRNSRIKNRWKNGESSSTLPFSLRRGKPFNIQTLITDSAFLISVNGYHFASYLHYIPFTLITKLTVKGGVTNVTMEKRSQVERYPERLIKINTVDVILMRSSSREAIEEVLSAETATGSKWRRSLTRRVLKWSEEIATPYLAVLPKNMLKAGRYLKIMGRVKLLPTSFFINLQKDVYIWPHPIVAFHFASKFSNKSENISKAKIVRCAWYDGSWSPEESSYIDTEFAPGKAFRIAILCVEDAYRIYLDGQFLLEFKYHMRPEVVDTIYIRGDVKLHWVSLHSSTDRGFQDLARTVVHSQINDERNKTLVNYESFN